MIEYVIREFERHVPYAFLPKKGWIWSDEKDDTIPYNAYVYYREIGVDNFRRDQRQFCIDNMFACFRIKGK